MMDAADKIRKLLKLAESPNINEAMAAAQRAQALMEKHNILEAELEVECADGSPEIVCATGESSGRLGHWKKYLWNAVCKANYCFPFTSIVSNKQGAARATGTTTLKAYGRRDGVETSIYIFKFFCNEIERLARYHGRGMGRKWNNSFKVGAASAIATKLEMGKEQARAEASNSTALVRLDDRAQAAEDFARNAHEFSNAKQRQATVDAAGYAIGQHVGAGISGPNPGLNRGTPKQRLTV